jgi:hypothetical protein
MFNSSQNVSILSLNCHINNISSVSCELFIAATYLNVCSYQMENNSNSIFYFHQLPSTNQSISVVTATVQTLTGRHVPTPNPLGFGFRVLGQFWIWEIWVLGLEDLGFG